MNQENKIILENLRKELHLPIKKFADMLISDVPENLKSVTIIGSATTEDFHPQLSDINTIVVVNERNMELLKLIAGYGKKLSKYKIRAPLLMTPKYIEESLDVFGIEFLDFQLNHITIFGQDYLSELTFQKEHVRLQCERDLKSALINLRQGYISFFGAEKPVGQLLYNCTKNLTFILRAMLWLIDVERPKLIQPTFKLSADKFSFQYDKIAPAIDALRSHAPPFKNIDKLFENIYQTAEHLAEVVNSLTVK